MVVQLLVLKLMSYRLKSHRRKVITVNEGINREWNSLYLLLVCIVLMLLVSKFVQLIVSISEKTESFLHDKEKCIGCAYCLYACPFGAPQFPQDGAFGTKGAMDKCTMCAGGPLETNSEKERHIYGQNRISEGKVPVCAAMCSTKALLVGESNEISKIYRERVLSVGHGVKTQPYGWGTAYGK